MIFADRRGWMKQDYLILMMMLVLSVIVSRGAWGDMIARAFNDSENGQALFAPLVAGYLFWLRRSRLQFIRYRPNLLGPALVAAGIGMAWWGAERDVMVVWHASAIIMVIGCVSSMTGIEVFRQFLPVILCLFFLIPTPGAIRIALAAPLQSFATGVTMSVLDFGNVLAVRDGNVILIGADLHPVAVGEACNGMRMVFALLLVVFGFVFSMLFRPGIRLMLLLCSPVIALTCNIFRLVLTSLAYSVVSPEVAESFHWAAGLAMLPLALVLLFGIVKLLRWLDVPTMSWRLAS